MMKLLMHKYMHTEWGSTYNLMSLFVSCGIISLPKCQTSKKIVDLWTFTIVIRQNWYISMKLKCKCLYKISSEEEGFCTILHTFSWSLPSVSKFYSSIYTHYSKKSYHCDPSILLEIYKYSCLAKEVLFFSSFSHFKLLYWNANTTCYDGIPRTKTF